MPPAVPVLDPPSPMLVLTDSGQEPEATSRRLARLLLLSVFALGLLGLSLPGHSIPVSSPIRITAAGVTTQVAVLPAAPARASRTRPAAAKPARKHVRVRPMWTRPSGAAIVSPFGMRWGRMHEGVDFGAPYGAPIVAIGDGVVVASGLLGEESGYGLITIVEHADGLYSAYAHQSATTVSPGQRVHAGQVIGYVGSSGHSFGPHLHFEIRTTLHGGQINPVGWFHKHHVWV